MPNTEEEKDQEKVTEEKVEAKPKPKETPKPPPSKQYYTIKMEATAPVTLEYRILAETPEQALEAVMRVSPWNNLLAIPKPNLHKMKRIKAKIYLSGTSLVKLTKNF